MAIRVALNHRTTYRYDRLVTLGAQTVRLRPAPHCRTPIVSYSLKASPEKHFINWQQDPHGNFLARLVFPELTDHFQLEVDLVAELTVINPFDFFLEEEATKFPFKYAEWLDSELAPYRKTQQPGPLFQEFINCVPRKSEGTIDFLVDLNTYVHKAVNYSIRMEPGVQTCEETLQLRNGSCRDSAWLLVQTMRHLGLAARFVSGYLIQLKPDVASLDGPSGAAADFTDLHAWTEVYLPGAGWVGLDPTSGLFTGEGHLPLAATPEPSSAAPITGGVDPCETEFEFAMSVERIHEDPRVTKPYTDEQWDRILRLGDDVDEVLNSGDVRLTMGGEPTFVSIDDMDGPEWNITAMGPDKRRLSGKLFTRLADCFASSPLMHYGQGKWYPGESLPRWVLACYWRKDLEPIWRDPRWIAKDEVDYGFTDADAQRFITALGDRLGVGDEFVTAGYEDNWYYLWKSRRLPVNVDPLKSQLSDPEERARIAKVFEQGLDKVIGYALPLRPRDGWIGLPSWESGPWFLRQEHMFLIPGDSPMGLRLPLDSLPWVAKKDVPLQWQRDPFSEPVDLPSYHQLAAKPAAGQWPRHVGNGHAAHVEHERRLVRQVAGVGSGDSLSSGLGSGDGNPDGDRGLGDGDRGDLPPHDFYYNGKAETPPHWIQPGQQQSAKHQVRTAVCVEARGGTLNLFMPPVQMIEEYLNLVSAVEYTAAKLSMPVRIEGYPPPHDERIQNFKVTPDPGVIEVNLQPSSEWRELVDNTNTLYDEARLTRLGTEKFMIDGRHTGTGGGNHIVLGGATPQNSPFLRRPELLGSLLRYWNNRPSLSYLFSGLFIGPTSQAPRADEARHESIYELETALAQLPKDGSGKPWVVDRVLRNLLVDLTGNTHRTEFCIDKLFSPDSSTGRLGLVEFRGFEMPPHARMSLTQQLLVRAMVAWHWNQPYTQKLVRWGTALHDRFMLPHFVAQDFQEVLEELNAAGFPFEQDWFDAHFEFRFPLVGQVTQRGIHIELRQAIEPWNVLGEEPAGGATVRHVDSSVERVQVTVRGMTDTRHVLACNGRRVPLHPTGTPGEFVAGVRFRAWQPPSCLHPTIGVHSPLTFDLIDSWNERSIGGCTWHVSHPGGRSFETFPVNAYEAESRRVARFYSIGHTGGRLPVPPEEANRDYPFTLDLRHDVQQASWDEGSRRS
jgi:uncharacterized protein (DUF2126 family)/transglutaminase-like putative cysteine protease